MRNIVDKLIPLVAWFLIRLIRLTLSISYVNDELIRQWTEEGKHFILAFWHGRLLLMPYSYPGKKISVLISKHRDGELIARTMAYFGFHSSRGSTTRGGAMGLRQMLRAVRDGYDLAFTPDGPKGPGYKVQMGVIEAARMTGLPVIPVSFGALKKKLSIAGTSFYCPICFQKPYLFTENRWKYLLMPTRINWKKKELLLKTA